MTTDYSTISAVLAKVTLFYEFCNNQAEYIHEEYAQEDPVLDREEYAEQYLDDLFDTMKHVEAEDYLNSYGFMTALTLWTLDVGGVPTNSVELLSLVATPLIMERLKAIARNENSPV